MTQPEATSHLVDIIVRARNGRNMTFDCIESIHRNTPAESYQVILVDDGSDPDLSDLRHDHYVYNGGPVHGAVRATNLGLALAHMSPAPFVMVLDNDTLIPEGDTRWLERMIDSLLAGGSRTGCVGATSGYVSPPQHILTVPQTYEGIWDGGGKENPPVAAFVSFACLFHKAVLKDCGPWDERYNPGQFEDTDYAVLIRSRGWEIRVAQSVYIHHKGHGTVGEQVGGLLEVNGQKFAEKWGIGRLYDLDIITAEETSKYVVARERERASE